MTYRVFEISDFKLIGGKLYAPEGMPDGAGLYGLLCKERPSIPTLKLPEGWLVRIGSSKNLRIRATTTAHTILWDGASEAKGTRDNGGLAAWLGTFEKRPGPEAFCLAVTCGPNHQFAERLIDKIAYDLTGSYPPCNACAPAINDCPRSEWAEAREEGGVSLARDFLGDIFEKWLASDKPKGRFSTP